MRRHIRTNLIVLAVILNLPAVLSAEEDNDVVPSIIHPMIEILLNPHYQEVLQLSDHQKESIKRLNDDWTREEQRLNELRSQLDRREFRRRLSTARSEFTKKANEFLTAEQRDVADELGILLYLVFRDSVVLTYVQDDLNLSAEQRRSIERIRSKFVRKVFAQVHGLQRTTSNNSSYWETPFQIKAYKIEESASEANRRRINELLTQDQRNRLHEIDLQREIFLIGGAIFLKTDIIKSLDLTDEQKRSMRQLNDEFEQSASALRPGKVRGDDGKERMLRMEFYKKVLPIMTVKQRQQWDRIVGKSFMFYLPAETTQSSNSEEKK